MQKQTKAIEEVHDYFKKENNEFLLIDNTIEDVKGGENKNPITD